MANKADKENNQELKGKAVLNVTRPEKFFILTLEHPNITESKLSVMAGYSKTYDICSIKSTKTYKRLRKEYFNKDIETRIKEAQERAGTTMEQKFGKLNKIITSDETQDKDVISAIKQDTDMTGEKRPEQLQHSIPGLEDALGHLFDE